MKKIFSLAIAIVVFTGMASAQDYDMHLTTVGNVNKFHTDRVSEVTYSNTPKGWVSLGYCLYREDFFASYASYYLTNADDITCEYYVEVQESLDTPGLYRLVNPYSPDICPIAALYPDSYLYDTSRDYFVEIDATDPEGVYIDYQDSGLTWGDKGRFYVFSQASMYYCYGLPWFMVKQEGYCGVLVDGVITFPMNSYGEHLLLSAIPKSYYSYIPSNYHEGFMLDLNDKSDKPGEKKN